MSDERSDSIFGGVETMLDDLEELYKKVHRRPELSMEEERTAALAAERLYGPVYYRWLLRTGPISRE
jgi:metal-dependent amidase/aminoacylase/carboxypeptidase family protein